MSRLSRSVDWVLILVTCILFILAVGFAVEAFKNRERRTAAAKKGEILIRVDKAYYSCRDTGIRW